HRVLFSSAPGDRPMRFDLGLFDAILVHASLLQNDHGSKTRALLQQLLGIPGFKALIPMPGRDLSERVTARVNDFGLQSAPHPGWSICCPSGDACQAQVVALDNWLDSLLPRGQQARLVTVLAGYESPVTGRCHRVLGSSLHPLDTPSTPPGP